MSIRSQVNFLSISPTFLEGFFYPLELSSASHQSASGHQTGEIVTVSRLAIDRYRHHHRRHHSSCWQSLFGHWFSTSAVAFGAFFGASKPPLADLITQTHSSLDDCHLKISPADWWLHLPQVCFRPFLVIFGYSLAVLHQSPSPSCSSSPRPSILVAANLGSRPLEFSSDEHLRPVLCPLHPFALFMSAESVVRDRVQFCHAHWPASLCHVHWVQPSKLTHLSQCSMVQPSWLGCLFQSFRTLFNYFSIVFYNLKLLMLV